MKACVQRVSYARVLVDGTIVGEIGAGFLVLLGVAQSDTKAEAELLAAKIAKLRVFEDTVGKMNLSLLDTGGQLLVVSQFTLCADLRKGNRPSFIQAAAPAQAVPLYEYFQECLIKEGLPTPAHGVFGADMQLTLCNNGPVTIWMDTDLWRK
ncbi:MAG: D-tyrosyl-tRNA(Tyr) deacylase [Oscillospiraceae bacterium]|jgi:D-tyrosyl-tRNA(Tyr) deacylase|nr:D-tyrosyl-tRNA(Tyr) deacylase [Oscillospiraceae bacterium]